MLLLVLLAIASVLALVVLQIAGRHRYTASQGERSYPLRFPRLAPAGLYAVEKGRVMERFPEVAARIMQRISALHGFKDTLVHAKSAIGEMILSALFVLLGCSILGMAAGGDPAVALLGLLGACLTPVILINQMDRQVKKRKRDIIMELPEVLSKMILLINAGETVQKALSRCVDSSRLATSALQVELVQAARELEMNASLPKVMEDLNKRCAMQEIALFTTTILLNYRRGGEDFLVALRSLSKELWDRRKAESRKLGEEASSKLVIPMVLIFVVVMVVVAAPAMLSMNSS
ncbi:type II secretion system F family protein [Paenibacillus sp. FJAT-26967]|uniref:type II secretion system F family protein n=1 Tax=Paenibacillus sp. FJAT-26967 TaxID=1729690 RepID=UPI0008390CF4|nr:type II secretion system F family protein [Paenibacillus sp. FJAT-26967]